MAKPDGIFRHLTAVRVSVSTVPGSACHIDAIIAARYIGNSTAGGRYNVHLSVDLSAMNDLTRVLIRGLHFPSFSGAFERIVYTA